MTPPPSDHFNGKTFFQAHDRGSTRRRDFWKWRFTSKPRRWPASVALTPQPPRPAPRGDDVVVTWIGHATFLLETTHGNFLTDPVFSERVSPVRWLGPRRVHPPGIAFADLPRIDVVLLTHDHYDHWDATSVRELAVRHNPLFVAPLRHEDLLAQAGARRTALLDWWQSRPLASEAVATLTPAKHWSNRLGTPRNHRLWGGFFLTLGSPPPHARRIWFVGDSGYDSDLFRAVRLRCGAPDLALVPIGAYEPRWFMAPMHMNPAEAVRLHRDVGARRSMGMHWGTFQLTDEGRDEPPQALAVAREAAGLRPGEFDVLEPGASIVVKETSLPHRLDKTHGTAARPRGSTSAT